MHSSPKVRDLFFSSGRDELRTRLRLPSVPTGLTHLFTDFEWHGLAARVDDLLDINLVNVLVAGWKKHREVREQLRVTAADPSRTVFVYIRSHTLDSTHHPSIELRSEGRRLVELSFPIALTFKIAAVELTLRGGAICEIRSEEVQVRGTVKFENTVILERTLSKVRLPGRIVLDPARPQSADSSRNDGARKSRSDSPAIPCPLPPEAARM
jgi:hypothetical protein